MKDEHGLMVVGCVILDLGLLGFDYRAALSLVIYSDNSEQNLDWAINLVYNSTINDLISSLASEPAKVIELIKMLPNTLDINDVILHVNHEIYNDMVMTCQEHILKIYMYLYSQYKPIENIITIPVSIGFDHIVVRELSKDLDIINSMIIQYRD